MRSPSVAVVAVQVPQKHNAVVAVQDNGRRGRRRAARLATLRHGASTRSWSTRVSLSLRASETILDFLLSVFLSCPPTQPASQRPSIRLSQAAVSSPSSSPWCNRLCRATRHGLTHHTGATAVRSAKQTYVAWGPHATTSSKKRKVACTVTHTFIHTHAAHQRRPTSQAQAGKSAMRVRWSVHQARDSHDEPLSPR